MKELFDNDTHFTSTVFDHINDAIVISGMDMRIHFWNKGAEKIFGWKKEEMIGNLWYKVTELDFLHTTLYKSYQDLILKKNWLGEIRIKTKDGRYVIAESNASLYVNKQKNVKRMIAVLRDITAYKENLYKMKQTEDKLREAVAAKDKFFRILSHDLRSPMQSFITLSEIMLKELQAPDLDEMEKILSSMHQAANNVWNLLENLLEWSVSQSNKIEINKEIFVLPILTDDCIRLYNSNILKKNIRIKINVDNDLEVYADKTILKIIINNLLSNAIKYSQHGGKVKVNAYIEKKGYENKSDLTMEFIDNGVGIEEKDLGSIFKLDKFFTTQGTNKEMGSGLGLVLVNELIQKHGGQIEVESAPGKGTKFTVKLPQEKETVPMPQFPLSN